MAFADIDHKYKSTNSRRKDTSCQGYEECFWLSDTRYDEKNACGKAENAHGFFIKLFFWVFSLRAFLSVSVFPQRRGYFSLEISSVLVFNAPATWESSFSLS